MIKVIETIVVITLLIFAFFSGVKYSEAVKEHANWLFESDEVELPDLKTNSKGEIIEEIEDEGADASEEEAVPAAVIDSVPAQVQLQDAENKAAE